MSNILVIQPDAEIASQVLQLINDSHDWQGVGYASLDEVPDDVEQDSFLAVVTGLALASADDYALLKTLLKIAPLCPVLLTGSDGTVGQVVDALQAGADGFVHSNRLGEELIENIEHLANSAHRSQSNARLLHCMTSSTSTFAIENDPLLMPTLLIRLQSSIKMFEICSEADRTRLGIALEEALSNALYHGNLGVSSELRKESLEAYYELAGERRQSPPYCDRRIHITETLTADAATWIIRDEGDGFETSRLNEMANQDNLEAVSGRGILMMRAFMDEVTFNDKGNEVTLVKRKKDAG